MTSAPAVAQGLGLPPVFPDPLLIDLGGLWTPDALSALIQRLVDALDDMTGNPDDEPVLGAPEHRQAAQGSWSDGGDCGERERVSEGEGEQCDDEGWEEGP